MSGFRVRPRGCGALHPDRVANARRGVTLTEAVLFISVALGIIVGGLVYFQQARNSDKTMEFVRLARMVQTGARDIARGGDLVGCIEEDTLAAGQYVPAAYHHDADADGVIDSFRSPRYDDVLMDVSICGAGQGHHPSIRTLQVNTLFFALTEIDEATCTRVLPVTPQGKGLLGDDIVLVGVTLLDLGTQPPSVSNLFVSPAAGQEITPSEAATYCGIAGADRLAVTTPGIAVRF